MLGSHTGPGFSVMVLAIVVERLAQPEGDWRSYCPKDRPASCIGGWGPKVAAGVSRRPRLHHGVGQAGGLTKASAEPSPSRSEAGRYAAELPRSRTIEWCLLSGASGSVGRGMFRAASVEERIFCEFE